MLVGILPTVTESDQFPEVGTRICDDGKRGGLPTASIEAVVLVEAGVGPFKNSANPTRRLELVLPPVYDPAAFNICVAALYVALIVPLTVPASANAKDGALNAVTSKISTKI